MSHESLNDLTQKRCRPCEEGLPRHDRRCADGFVHDSRQQYCKLEAGGER